MTAYNFFIGFVVLAIILQGVTLAVPQWYPNMGVLYKINNDASEGAPKFSWTMAGKNRVDVTRGSTQLVYLLLLIGVIYCIVAAKVQRGQCSVRFASWSLIIGLIVVTGGIIGESYMFQKDSATGDERPKFSSSFAVGAVGYVSSLLAVICLIASHTPSQMQRTGPWSSLISSDVLSDLSDLSAL